MARTVRRPFREIAFVGGRFDEAAGLLDLDVLNELRVYRKIVVETAKGLWRQGNRDRRKLPSGFEDGLRLGISGEIGEGSVRVSIARAPSATVLDIPDAFDNAADIIDETLVALHDDKSFPKGMTSPTLREFEKWGKSLTDRESIVLGAPGGQGVAFNAKIRERLTDRLPKPYFDTLDLTGEVRAADLGNKAGGSFRINLDYHRDAVYGRFTDEQEATITEALNSHDNVRLKFLGRCEFSPNGEMRRITEIHDCEIVREEDSVDPDPASILRIFDEIHKSTPESAWANMPTDGARNYKHYLYGFPKEGEE